MEMRSRHRRGCSGLFVAKSLMLLLVCSGAVMAQAGMEPYQEYDKRIRAAEQVGPLSDDLFGDQVSLFNGQTEFANVDIDLPGNNGLPVQLRRRLPVIAQPANTFIDEFGGVGNWDIDVPYISGVFDANYRWNTIEGVGYKPRCSTRFFPSVRSQFRLRDIWSGYSVHIPGGGDREVLTMDSSLSVPMPPDGHEHLWTTRDLDAFTCTASMMNGYTGEGFVMRTTSGLTYTFDVGVERNVGAMRKGNVTAVRVKVYLLASKIEDRFGNRVEYSYDGDGYPTRIASSDGRVIVLAYADKKLTSATVNGRQWEYQYHADGKLQSVTLPDKSGWRYSYEGATRLVYQTWDVESGCSQPEVTPGSFSVLATHPSGASGRFDFTHGRHYRSGVRKSNCILEEMGGKLVGYLHIPYFYDVFSLKQKTLSGPGLDSLTWTYGYGQRAYGMWGTSVPMDTICEDETICPRTRDTTVTKPNGDRDIHTFGILFGLNEGKLLGLGVLGKGNQVLRKETYEYLSELDAPAQPFPDRYGLLGGGDDPSSTRNRPSIGTTIVQDGVQFQSAVARNCGGIHCFDRFARPLQTVKSSSLGYTRSDAIGYHDNLPKWVLGQQASLTNLDTGKVESQTAYDGNAQPAQVWSFGKLQQSLAYYGDGTVATVKDGNGNATTLSSWYRGVPRQIRFADGTTRSADVDDNGWIIAGTDENGYATRYGHDAMGRMTSRTWPSGDSTAWNTSTQAFTAVGADEYGITAGHWRQTVSTGNARKVTYFDALWRPLVVHEFDAAAQEETQRYQRFLYDHAGRVTFASYPRSQISGGYRPAGMTLSGAVSLQEDCKEVTPQGSVCTPVSELSSAAAQLSTLAALVDGAVFSSQSLPATMQVGQTYAVTVSFRNTGDTTWSLGESYRLGSMNSTPFLWGTERVEMAESVAPSRTATFHFNVTAPSAPGAYAFQWRMLREGVSWFGDAGQSASVQVTSPTSTLPPSPASDNDWVGTWTEYDALGRVTAVAEVNDQESLITLTEYLPGLQMRVTNPRGNQTLTYFMAYDQPGYDWPVLIQAPEGSTTSIRRNVFGQPLEVAR